MDIKSLNELEKQVAEGRSDLYRKWYGIVTGQVLQKYGVMDRIFTPRNRIPLVKIPAGVNNYNPAITVIKPLLGVMDNNDAAKTYLEKIVANSERETVRLMAIKNKMTDNAEKNELDKEINMLVETIQEVRQDFNLTEP